MKYLSATHGTLHFQSSFVKEYLDLINDWVDLINTNPAKDAGILHLDNQLTNGSQNIKFTGSGDEVFESSATNIFMPLYVRQINHVIIESIMVMLHAAEKVPFPTITVSYDDYNPVIEHFVHIEGFYDFSTITPTFHVTKSTPIDITDKNVIIHHFSEGYNITDDWSTITDILSDYMTIEDINALKPKLLADPQLDGFIQQWKCYDPVSLINQYLTN